MNELLGRERLERQGFFRPDEVARRIAEHQSGDTTTASRSGRS